MLELLSHFGCDLLSLLAVSLQVFDLHRQRAVPHHQHGFLVWEQRTPRTSRWQTGTHTCERDSVGQTVRLTALILVRCESSTQNQHHILPVYRFCWGGRKKCFEFDLNMWEDILRSERHNTSANCEQNAAPFHTFFSTQPSSLHRWWIDKKEEITSL